MSIPHVPATEPASADPVHSHDLPPTEAVTTPDVAEAAFSDGAATAPDGEVAVGESAVPSDPTAAEPIAVQAIEGEPEGADSEYEDEVPPAPPGPMSKFLGVLLGIELILLLALAQMFYAQYQVGVGNQSIQIPFLKHAIDPQLYSKDPMVQQTLKDYPSYFFRLLGKGLALLSGGNLQSALDSVVSAYFWLHLLTTAGLLGASYWLGHAMFRSRGAAITLVLLMLAGHHQGLAGDTLYSKGFTHTYAALPLAVAALAMLYQGWRVAAFAMVGLIFNIHALTAGYLLAMFLMWALVEFWQAGKWWRILPWLGAFALLAAPTAVVMAQKSQNFSAAEWLVRMRIRSADHSFPLTWWTTGNVEVPRFMLLLGLAGASMSLVSRYAVLRTSHALGAGVAMLFLAGVVFTEFYPLPIVVRAQLFRASRLLLVLALAHIANGVVSGWRMMRTGYGFPAQDVWPHDPRASYVSRLLEGLLATVTFACVAIPGYMANAPLALAGALVVSLINGRLSGLQSTLAAAALMVVIAAWQMIDFHIPALDWLGPKIGRLATPGESYTLAVMAREAWHDSLEGLVTLLKPARQLWNEAGYGLAAALAIGAGAWVAIRLTRDVRVRLGTAVLACAACALLVPGAYRKMAMAGTSKDEGWLMAQLWAAGNTPKEAMFLAPAERSFRIHSGRSVVGEWRDGTQAYFTADFASNWWSRMQRVRPETYDVAGRRLLSRGTPLEKLSDSEILAIAKDYGATYIVLPADRNREILPRFEYGDWVVYEARSINPAIQFFESVVLPNVERNRKSDVKLVLVDEQDKPINGSGAGAEYDVVQTRQAFKFGVSIPPFAAREGWSPEWTSPPVNERQLAAVKEVFNYTVIPFSAKWNFLEPEEGKRDYSELDKLVDWCSKNGIEMEFHYLSGFAPPWTKTKSKEQLRELWMEYCRQTVARYQDRIKYWQVDNDDRDRLATGDVIKEMRTKYPHLKIGVADCAYFHAATPQAEQLLRKGVTEIEQLKAEGAPVDFFGHHGHGPRGVWPDMRIVYSCLDEYAKLGVRVHITEATISLGTNILGSHEGVWTPELQAEFFEQFYTTLFSHPAVDVVNYWDLSYAWSRDFTRGGGGPGGGGPRSGFGGMRGGMRPGGTGGGTSGGAAPANPYATTQASLGTAGLLDPTKDDEPRLGYLKLKELIRGKWMTRAAGKLAGGDGDVELRGFHGDYQITLKTVEGKTLKGTFAIQPGEAQTVRVKMVESK